MEKKRDPSKMLKTDETKKSKRKKTTLEEKKKDEEEIEKQIEAILTCVDDDEHPNKWKNMTSFETLPVETDDETVDEKDRFGRIKDRLEIKKKKKEERRSKRRKSKQKNLAGRLGRNLKWLTNLFTGKKAEKAKSRAMSNMRNKNVGNVSEGDITFRGGGKGGDDEQDVWIEDPSVLTNTQHRPELQLVQGNETNKGHLFHEGKRPFWKNKQFAKDTLPMPKENPSSTLLVEVVNEVKPIAEPLAPPSAFDTEYSIDELKIRNTKWFTDEQILANTIRSVIYTMSDDLPPAFDGKVLPPMPYQIPIEVVLYERHNVEMQRSETFKPTGGLKKKGKKGDDSSSSFSSSDKYRK